MSYIRDFLKALGVNISVCIKGDFAEGVQDPNILGNFALRRLDRKSVTPSLKGIKKLTPDQRRALRRFYAPYIRHITDRYHRLYADKTGIFTPRYIPEELFFTRIDRFYSDREEARYLDNKCYYYRLFSNIKQPTLVVMRVGSAYLDDTLSQISADDAADRVGRHTEVVLKRAVNSQGGYGVEFYSGSDLKRRFRELMHSIDGDVVIQLPVKQHSAYARLHPESVNTMRIVSLLTDDTVKVYAVCVKIGVGKERRDNGCHGGIYCGVDKGGRLKKLGILDNGTVLFRHPQLGYRFEDVTLPYVDKAVSLVKQAHPFMGHFRLISWDVAIDEEGEAVLIESNLSLGGINNVQICNGPLFGDDTEMILDEVFQKGNKTGKV